MKKKKKDKISDVALVGIICDNILHESSKMTSCEIRIMLHNAIDLNKIGQSSYLIAF